MNTAILLVVLLLVYFWEETGGGKFFDRRRIHRELFFFRGGRHTLWEFGGAESYRRRILWELGSPAVQMKLLLKLFVPRLLYHCERAN